MQNTRKCRRFANGKGSPAEGNFVGAPGSLPSFPFRVVGMVRGSVQLQFPGFMNSQVRGRAANGVAVMIRLIGASLTVHFCIIGFAVIRLILFGSYANRVIF